MALTDQQKASRLFKKSLGAGETILARDFFEEPKLGNNNILPNQIWSEGDQITNTAPILGDSAIIGVIQYFSKLTLTHVPGSTNLAYSHDNLKNTIPFNFGDGSYNYSLYKNDGTTQIPFGQPGGDWLIDNTAGVLTFYGTLPVGVTSSLPPKISFYKYVGATGMTAKTSLFDSGSSSAPSISFKDDTNTGIFLQSQNNIGISVDGIEYFRFESTGTFTAYDVVATSSTPSDIRLKENINELETPLEKILKLKGVNFNYKNKTNDIHSGYIAQEIEKIIPNVVIEKQLPFISDNQYYKVIRYEEIIPYITDAIKEQQVMINNIKSSYTLPINASCDVLNNNEILYFSCVNDINYTIPGISYIYITKSGIIKNISIIGYSSNAGSDENWTMYLIKNNDQDIEISTVSTSLNTRHWVNLSLNINVNIGDKIEIKSINPNWLNNPSDFKLGGYLYIEY